MNSAMKHQTTFTQSGIYPLPGSARLSGFIFPHIPHALPRYSPPSLRHPHSLCILIYVIGSEWIGLEGPYSSILGIETPETTLTHLPSFFGRSRHSCIRRHIMSKTRLSLMQWRGVVQKLWLIADEINNISNLVRYADKPSDLVYPITKLLQITRRLDVFRDQWLLKWLKSRGEGLKNWPKLHERYL